MGLIYDIDLSGTTFSGSTAFLGNNPTFTPLENFFLDGALLLETGIFPSNQSANNDINIFEIAVFAGSVFDVSVQAGEIQFVSNTALHTYLDGNFSQLASLDLVNQQFDELTGTWQVSLVDETTSRLSQLNTFNTTSNLISAPKQVLQGTVTFQFSEDFQQIQGSIILAGSGLIEPGTYGYSAEFTGFLAGTYVGFAEQGVANSGV